jgi:hypothetical protein
MESEFFSSARSKVEHLFESDLKKGFVYHSLDRTLGVLERAKEIAEEMQLPEEDKEVVLLAALFHDTGRTSAGDQDLFQESASICRSFLEENGMSAERLDRVVSLILSLSPEEEVTSPLKGILRDAMLAYLSNEHYLRHLEDLRWEERVYQNLNYDDNSWLKLQRKRLKAASFTTEAGNRLYGDQKKKNEKELKKLSKTAKGKKDLASRQSIGDSRTAQMMFKTALRNHIDLTNIADNKANIMLSINAIIITITMPLVASNIQGNGYLIVPASSLMLTCMLSIIYATLATRPIKMTGYTDLRLHDQGKTNLFFFGNFFKMKISEYHQGIREVIASEEILENSILNDLYYLGAALGHKYRQLRVCYNIFMIGISFTVIAFALSFMFLREGGAIW